MPPVFDKTDFTDDDNSKLPSDFLNNNKVPLASGLIGLSLLGLGFLSYKQNLFAPSESVEIISAPGITSSEQKEIIVEIAGEVIKPGVYKLREGSRIEDILIVSGGYSVNADRQWLQKYLNKAARLTDGQKLYIPNLNEQTGQTSASIPGGIKTDQQVFGVSQRGLININNASLSELDSLPGIGQVYGQKIIEQRPYSSVEELLSKGVLKQSVYDKIKDKVSVY